MSNIGELIAREALDWLGTPFRWQGRVKGRGCDCKGLVAGVASACGRPEGDSLEALAGDYGAKVDSARLLAGLRRLFDSASEIERGDVLLLRMNGRGQHLALALSPVEIVHCMAVGPRRVVRVPLPAGRLDSVWRWKDLGKDLG